MNEYELDAIQNEMAEGCDCTPEVSSEPVEHRGIPFTSVSVHHEPTCKLSRINAAPNN